MGEDFQGLKNLGSLLVRIVGILAIVALVLIGLVAVTCGGAMIFSR